MDDTAIIQLYFARKEEAISQTDKAYGPYCRSIAGNILRNREDVREVLNDTWLAAWNAIPPQIPRSLAAFLGKITRRLAITRLEARLAAKRGGGEAVLALEELSECIPSPVTPQQQLEGQALAQLLNDFVRSLPPDQRRVFLLRYWYLEPIAAIGRRTGFSQSKVKSMLHRTRNVLKIRLEQEGYEL